jgi:2-polyprenyl-3-methyl-5-hydroxy-6-metoxy-1,4-benzoquinol methylase
MKFLASLEANAAAYEIAQKIVSLSFRCFRKALRENDFFHPDASYLDVGCGTGTLKDFLSGQPYTGIDLNPLYIEYARRKRGMIFHVENVLNLSNINETFDRVIAIGLFHHLSDEEASIGLRQCISKLNPKGEFFIIDALMNPRPGLGSFLRKSDNGSFVRTQDEWKQLFEQNLCITHFQKLSQWPFEYIFCKARILGLTSTP